ncbi:hypothetical protein CVT26_001749 [Gymnopilus dilepis]|uniref:Uncharacterized protein n=1 Tax=Gymnopilus dilepis TaxID=231916 RepID=A0A409WE50_9AGAR|nr:hypothetical protein CVT26_001749 [Gymnopilus dilepis]
MDGIASVAAQRAVALRALVHFLSIITRGKDHTDTLSNYKQPYEAYTTDGTHYDLRQVEVQKEEESRAKKL